MLFIPLNKLNHQNISLVSSFPFGNLAKLKASNEHEELDRLIQRRFGPEKRVNIIDMSLPEDLARDKGIFSNKTCTIDEQPSVYCKYYFNLLVPKRSCDRVVRALYSRLKGRWFES